MTEQKRTFKADVADAKADLARLRDELKLKVSLGRKDAADLWAKVEPALQKAEKKLESAATQFEKGVEQGAEEARLQAHLGVAEVKKSWPGLEGAVTDIINDVKAAAADARTELDEARVKGHLAALDADGFADKATSEIKRVSSELEQQTKTALDEMKKSFESLKKRLS